MALLVTDCRGWQGHQWMLILPLNSLNHSRLPFVPKLVVSHFGGRHESLRFNKSGVKTIGRLQRSSFLSIPSELKSGRLVTRRFSEFGLNGKLSDGEDQTDEGHRPPFDLDLGVLLAGFAFESYNTPEKNVGVLEMDGQERETIYLSRSLNIYSGENTLRELAYPLNWKGNMQNAVFIDNCSIEEVKRGNTVREFIRSIYDGQLFVNLKKGANFPGLDLWGTSDPYVVLRIGDCSVRSRTIWANKDPVWNESLTLNIQTSAGPKLQVAAWDANMVTSPRRLGNTALSLESLCDGQEHSLELDLEGMGGGGRLFLEVQFKSFDEIEAEKNRFSFAGLFSGELLTTAYKSIFGESGISVGDFMGDFTSMLNKGIDISEPENAIVVQEGTSDKPNDGNPSELTGNSDKDGQAEIWKNITESFSQNLEPLGIDISGILTDEGTWEVGETIRSLGLESEKRAELLYAESGLAIVENQTEGNQTSSATELNGNMSRKHEDSLLPGKEVLEGLIEQTEGIVGAWAIFNKSQGEIQGEGEEQPTAKELGTAVTTTTLSTEDEKSDSTKEDVDVDVEIDGIKTTMFSTAESAMEAWALLATTLGGTSSVKSDFEKICFVENKETDTQVALWRDLRRQRLVVAFRGTEQTKWKDVVTDLSLLAVGFNPERVTQGSNPKEEPLVHSGFLKAYDSVKGRILSLVRASIDSSRWHIYVTGHSLGGALATLFALELSSSKLAKNQNLNVTMYNYGSPRVGNRVFADKYNKIVRDSWRVVNHRDIVPTVPRLMGYCHVAEPIYLTAENSPVSDLLDDGYKGDVIGESTAEVIIDKFMKGEQAMLQKLLETEISMLRAMRDGSAVMQHMEDFYYITLLQRVESRIR